jgi:ribose 5-phosphate isomerase B
MKVAIGSDHGGYQLKENIKAYLKSRNIQIDDYGTNNEESVDYPDYAAKVAKAVLTEVYDFGILLCGTGIGISIAANKFKGIRAALVYDPETAHLAKAHNNANIIAIGGRTTTKEMAKQIIDAFIETKYEERHNTRLHKIAKLEE